MTRWASRGIFSSILTVGVCTGLVKAAGLAKAIAIAGRFGIRDDLDAYLIAFAVPAFCADVVGGAVSASLLPAFVETRERSGAGAAQRVLASSLLAVVALLGAVALGLGLWLRPIIGWLAPGFAPAKVSLTVSLAAVVLPISVFGGLSSVLRNMLGALDQFAVAAAIPIVTPVSIVASVYAGGAGRGAYTLAAGTLCGGALELALAVYALRVQGFSARPAWHGFDPALRQVFRQYAPMMAATILMGASMLVDQSMAARLGPGSVAVLNYGTRLAAFVTAMGPAVIGTAVFPHFARMAARGESRRLTGSVRSVLGALLLVSLPATAALVLFSEPLVRVLLERGAFNGSDTRLVAAFQRLTLLQIPFYMLTAPLVRLLSALRGNALLLWAALIHLAANVGLDFVLMRRYGITGIALATALVAAIYFGCTAILLSRRIRNREDGPAFAVPAIELEPRGAARA